MVTRGILSPGFDRPRTELALDGIDLLASGRFWDCTVSKGC